MDSNIWYLVIFKCSTDKPQMEYVPDFWIKRSENKVSWPPYKNSACIVSAINNRQEPDKTWILCDVQTIWWKCPAMSKEEILSKLQLAETVSEDDLNDEYEKLQNKNQRKFRQKKNFQSDSQSSEETQKSGEKEMDAVDQPTMTMIGNFKL